MSTSLRLTIAAALFLPFATAAQDAFFNSVNQGSIDYAGTVALNSALNPDEDAGDVSDNTQGVTTPGTGFTASDEVSWQVRNIFLDAYRSRPPLHRARYAKQIDSGWAQGPFHALLEQHRLKSNDFADVASAYFIALWSVIHDRRVTEVEARGAIAQVRRVLQADPATVPSSDSARQILSEAYGIYAGLVLREQARRANDPVAAKRLRERVAARSRAQGMDLLVLELTPDGFRPATPRPSGPAGGN